MKSGAKLTGAEYLLRWFGGKPSKALEKSTRKGITTGARIVLRQQKSKVPVRTKLLQRSLGSKVKKYGLVYVGIIGVRRGFRVKVTAIRKNRMLATATVRTRAGVKTRQMNLVASPRVKVGDYLDPLNYAHLIERSKKFVGQSVQSVQKEIDDIITAGLRGELV